MIQGEVFGQLSDGQPCMFTYQHSHPPQPALNCRLEIGLDTIRIGFWPWAASWDHRSRLKKAGWKYRSDWKCWWKHHPDSGMRWRHWRKWIDVEVSLPRIIGPNNSSLDYDPWQALAIIRQELDADIRLELTNSVFQAPDWDEWCVSRTDITVDFIFEKASLVGDIITNIRKAKMNYRPHRWSNPHSVKWASQAHKMAGSIYDKFEKDGRQLDEGKLRMSVIINERRNKPHLREYGMQRVPGLFDGDDGKFLAILVAEIKRVRPKGAASTLRYLLEKATEAYHHEAGSKK